MSQGLQVKMQETLRGANGPFHLELDFHLPPGEWLGIYGPSGAGKTTLLRSIAGLHRPTNAQISFQGHPWQDEQQFLTSRKRPLGMVFQDQGLFPHLRLAKQIAYGLEGNAKNAAKVTKWIQDLGLRGLEKARMRHLSGGQQQRVALARTLITAPQVLLLDEPFQGLDETNLQQLLKQLNRIRSARQTTAILVSHRQEVLSQICDQLMQLKGGRLEQQKPMAPTITIQELQDGGKDWELVYLRNGTLHQIRIPKALFPELKKGDRIQILPPDPHSPS